MKRLRLISILCFMSLHGAVYGLRPIPGAAKVAKQSAPKRVATRPASKESVLKALADSRQIQQVKNIENQVKAPCVEMINLFQRVFDAGPGVKPNKEADSKRAIVLMEKVLQLKQTLPTKSWFVDGIIIQMEQLYSWIQVKTERVLSDNKFVRGSGTSQAGFEPARVASEFSTQASESAMEALRAQRDRLTPSTVRNEDASSGEGAIVQGIPVDNSGERAEVWAVPVDPGPVDVYEEVKNEFDSIRLDHRRMHDNEQIHGTEDAWRQEAGNLSNQLHARAENLLKVVQTVKKGHSGETALEMIGGWLSDFVDHAKNDVEYFFGRQAPTESRVEPAHKQPLGVSVRWVSNRKEPVDPTSNRSHSWLEHSFVPSARDSQDPSVAVPTPSFVGVANSASSMPQEVQKVGVESSVVRAFNVPSRLSEPKAVGSSLPNLPRSSVVKEQSETLLRRDALKSVSGLSSADRKSIGESPLVPVRPLWGFVNAGTGQGLLIPQPPSRRKNELGVFEGNKEWARFAATPESFGLSVETNGY